MMRQVIWTTSFKKDYKLALKRDLPINELDVLINLLALDRPLPNRYKDHALKGVWFGFRECHILSDWLLIYGYSKDDTKILLARTGSHAELFK